MKMPENIYINICKISQEVFKNRFEADTINRVNLGTRKDESMYCEYRISRRDHVKKVEFSYYDAVVCDAVYTIYRTNCNKFTITDLIRVMTGDENVRLSHQKDNLQKREKRLLDSLNRLMNTCITIVYGDEAKKRKLKDEQGKLLKPEKCYIGNFLVPLHTEDGKVFWFLEHKGMPTELPLYRYAEKNGQIICVPRKLLLPQEMLKTAVKDQTFLASEEGKKLLSDAKISNTDEIMLLKRILIQRLEVMGNTKNNVSNRKILYYGAGVNRGILPMAGIVEDNFAPDEKFEDTKKKVRCESRSWKNKVSGVNKKLCAILNIYKKCGYITDYELLRVGNDPKSMVRGVEILGDINVAEIRKLLSVEENIVNIKAKAKEKKEKIVNIEERKKEKDIVNSEEKEEKENTVETEEEEYPEYKMPETETPFDDDDDTDDEYDEEDEAILSEDVSEYMVYDEDDAEDDEGLPVQDTPSQEQKDAASTEEMEKKKDTFELVPDIEEELPFA